jgi:GR25 family glycosyltransferase involved in LPS biosynthesis
VGNYAGGRKIIATSDWRRLPGEGEVIIIYGNYPHIFENIVINNPIKRHVSMFGEFDCDEVEYDARWDRVEQIYIINDDDRPDRYDSILRELVSARAPHHRITRIPAVRDHTAPTPLINGQIGCLSSHIEALRRAKTGGFDHVLVLEDDFCFTEEVDAHLDDLRSFLNRDEGYLVCLLATSKYGRIIPKDDLVCVSLQPCTNTAAYLVSREGLAQLLPVQEFALQNLKETHNCTKYAVDRYWSVLQTSGKFLVFHRKFGFQASSFSDIERQICRYFD